MFPVFLLLPLLCRPILIDPTTYPSALSLLTTACHTSNSTLTTPLNLSISYLHWNNHTCGLCKKTFRNDSFLGFHWLSKHYHEET